MQKDKSFLIRYGMLFIVLVSLVVGGLAFLFRVPPAGQAQSFRIAPGESVTHIASRLADDHLIGFSMAFTMYAAWSGMYGDFKPGTYVLAPQPVWAVAHELAQGPQDVAVTIAPGMTLIEIDQRLSREGIIPAGSLEALSPGTFVDAYPFLKGVTSFEGFFMPDTYRFAPDSKPADVVTTLLDNFVARTKNLWQGTSASDVQRTIIVASLLEKEVIDFKDKQLVAGIIQKRLDAGMPLQIDASVLYGACGGTFLDCPSLRASDFKRDTPFNTYLHKGLPPHAIDNPTLDSIRAALSPLASSYWFYLTDPTTKKTIFSATFNEHIASQVHVGI